MARTRCEQADRMIPIYPQTLFVGIKCILYRSSNNLTTHTFPWLQSWSHTVYPQS